ncbi:leucyl-tRNA synthetase [Candidatus Blochmanniella floridana]|uniref:Leucine--tRNA ligase n=1 Tax=Blochmanniella floridana TaxID=203907 RepID=SYL_BLOFL|nr:RecName: Full=Leucine--tRNA ligase; AltName: Full=Leucyl-tRNA synthetase; Short=LeuRS [Candidatus Blochmannia floridanus]CAD83383.1 leucyl-tRNA synthetase [Candidatus Blochmannia floridanus]
MKKLYFPHQIERIVQQHWNDNQTFSVTEDKNKQKFYCLSMLPYPSGNLHMGHVRNYTIGDVISRYQRMLGKNVLQPIGWDAFGLPAEQAAIIHKKNPSDWTYSNIQYMKQQLKSLGFAYDWKRELITNDPQYYRWEQWFFIILYEKGLVYRKTTLVNWCPYHNTVLANEQVINGGCWRCHTKIQYKKIPQWFIKITHYADQLLNGLNQLQYWPEQVKTMQRNWIGQSTGTNVIFKILNSNITTITVYIARLDTFMGISYLTISVDHPITLQIAKINPDLANFISIYNTISIQLHNKQFICHKKKGIFTNLYAVHPITFTKLPIWVANFITPLEFDGQGAIASCPAHDQHDWEFAHQYDLPIKPVIKYADGELPNITNQAMIEPGILFNSDNFDDLTSHTAINYISKKLIDLKIAKTKIFYHLQDWGVSRQRYWGVPIPMIKLKNGIIQPVPKSELPVILPEIIYTKNNENNILSKNFNWTHTTYKNQDVIRDTDTFDTFMESSWYYARYTCPHYHDGMLQSDAANYWLPIDQYIGGIEHATMHLMYFRFYHKLMRDIGLIQSNEPAIRLLCQGMILADSFYYISNDGQKNWVSPNKVISTRDKMGHIIKSIDADGNNVIYAGLCKMSKSKNNGIDPNAMIQKYGADAVRFFIMFAAPAHSTLEWKESGIEGALRFLKRLWNITYQHIQNGLIHQLNMYKLENKHKIIRQKVHETIIKVTDDIDRRQSFNTALAAIMKLFNDIQDIFPINNTQDRSVLHEALSIIVKLLYPFTPHISYILWKELGYTNTIDDTTWPTPDLQAIQTQEILIIVQINGKKKKKIFVPINSDKNTIHEIAKQAIYQDKNLESKYVHKIIYIPNKIINFITK